MRSDKRTLYDLVLLAVLLAVLVGVSVPRATSMVTPAREAQARAATQDIRNAIGLFQTQCGDYPTSLTDLIASSPSPTGAHGVEIDPLSWHGPYLDALGGLPANPITGGNVGGADWIYTPATGAVHAAGLDDPPADLDW